MGSRLIRDLLPELQAKAKLFEEAMAKAGIPFRYTSTRRTQAEQDILYAQGRTTPGKIITWTKYTKHVEGKAFDIVLIKEGTLHWNIKVSVNDNEIPDYIEVGAIGKSVGLKWGGDFKGKDYVHFEI